MVEEERGIVWAENILLEKEEEGIILSKPESKKLIKEKKSKLIDSFNHNWSFEE